LAVEVKLKQLIRVSWLNYSYQTYLLEFPPDSRGGTKNQKCIMGVMFFFSHFDCINNQVFIKVHLASKLITPCPQKN